MKLIRPDTHFRKSKATEFVFDLAKSLNIAIPPREKLGQNIILENKIKKFRLNFEEEIAHAVKYGNALLLQSWFDAEDQYLQPTIEMASFSSFPGILNMTLGNYSVELNNYGIIESPETSLANDICYYHKSTCCAFNNEDVRGVSRYFRAYLHSCVSLIDCFLFRYAFFVKAKIGDMSQFNNTNILDSRAPVEERLSA